MVDAETDKGTDEGTDSREAWRGDESGPEPDGIFAGVLASYGERGYEVGYRRAVSDALGVLLLATEEYLRRGPDDRALREAVRAFEEFVERQLFQLGSRDDGYVGDGLGI